MSLPLAAAATDPPAAEPAGEGGADSHRLRANVSVLAGGQVVTWTMTLLWTLVIPRALGPASMGLVVTAWAVTGVLGVILGLGTRNFLVREMVVHPDRAPSLLGTAVVMRIGLAVPFFAGAALYASIVHLGSEGRLILFLACGATAFTLLAEPLQAGFQAIERMRFIAYNNMFDRVVQSVCGIALVLVGFRAVGLSTWWLIVEAALLALNFWWMRRYMRVDLRTSIGKIGSLFRKSLPYWTFGLFFMVYLWVDSAMLAAMVPAEVVGWYGVPTKLFNTLMFLPTILSTAWLPRLVAVFEKTPQRLNRAARSPMELMLVLSVPVAAGAAILAQPVIPLLYGPAYARAVPVLVILAFCIPPMYLNNMVAQVLIASNRQFAWTKVMVGATVVNPLLNLMLIRYTQGRFGNGALGAAASLVITEALIAVVGMLMVGRGILGLGSLVRLARALGVGLGMAAAVLSAQGLGMIAELGIAATSFVVLAWLLRLLSPEEKSELRRAFSRLAAVLPRRRRSAAVSSTRGRQGQ